MHKYDLSICLAAIRKDNWNKLYESILTSIGPYTFELIFCGPHAELPDELKGISDIKCIVDFGAPTRAQQIACIAAKGEYMYYAADDGVFMPGKLKKCLDILKAEQSSKKVLVTHYDEGGKNGLASYSCNFHEPVRSPYYPDSYLVFNSVFFQTDYFKEIGGLDCRFEVCPLAFVDLGVRCHRDGIKVLLLEEVVLSCTHMPDTSGDHAPVHYAQLGHDAPLYKQIYLNPNCVGRIYIDLENWVNAPDRWLRRFGKA